MPDTSSVASSFKTGSQRESNRTTGKVVFSYDLYKENRTEQQGKSSFYSLTNLSKENRTEQQGRSSFLYKKNRTEQQSSSSFHPPTYYTKESNKKTD